MGPRGSSDKGHRGMPPTKHVAGGGLQVKASER